MVMITSWRQCNVKNNYNIQLPMKYAHSSYMKNKITTFHIKEATKRCKVFKKLFCEVRHLSTMELPSLIYDHFLYPERSSPNTQIFNNIKYRAGLTYVLLESMP